MNTNKFLGFILPNGIAEKPGSNLNSLELNISICFFPNKAYQGLDPDNQTSDSRHTYTTFYAALQALKETDASQYSIQIDDENVLSKANSNTPFACFGKNQAQPAGNFQEVKNTLWDSIFPIQMRTAEGMMDVGISDDSRLDDPQVGEIESLFGSNKENLTHVNKLLRKERGEAEVLGRNETDVSEILGKINEYGVDKLAISIAEQARFYERHADNKDIQLLRREAEAYRQVSRQRSMEASEVAQQQQRLKECYDILIKLNGEAIGKYLQKAKIDIDEVITSYSTLSGEPLLMRLMGLTQDLKIPISASKLPPEGEETIFKLTFKAGGGEDILPVGTQIKVKRLNGKLAFLVNDSEVGNGMTYYQDSILLNTPLQDGDPIKDISMSIIRSDEMSLNYRAKGAESSKELEKDDSLTRGLLLTHPFLHKVIQPQQVDQLPTQGITDDYVIGGHRVALKWNNKMYSLTQRDVAVKIDDGRETIYKCDQYEGSINIDTPMQYLEDGEFKSVSSDVLFEYTGELLSLRSAFSKAVKVSKTEEFAEMFESGDSSGFFKSQGRVESKCSSSSKDYDKLLSYHKFPFNAVDDETDFLSMWFDIPQEYVNGEAPKLRFGEEYTFVVSQEYLNGWGLPLKSRGDNSLQLSAEEIANSGGLKYTPSKAKFEPLENKKPVKIFARKKIYEDASKPITMRDSLEHMVVRSNNRLDSKQKKTDRHVLPAQIELETAFWHNLLSKDHMTADESYAAKQRANCSFLTEKEFSKEHKKGQTCPEGCSKFCGGMQMKPFYPQAHITPKFLTDPGVSGFAVELFWDKDFEHKVQPDLPLISAMFSGEAGIKPRSYLLRGSGSKKENVIFNREGNEVLDVCLKKGAMIYARLTNQLLNNHKEYLKTNWKYDIVSENERTELLKSVAEQASRTSIDEVVSPRNIPKVVSMTHAVKEPIVLPTITKLASSPPDMDMIEHVDEWRGPYAINKNILANRVNEDTGEAQQNSTILEINLKSHFERLDAISKSQFLSELLPTGALELWVRKEEFVDDPDQIVLSDPKRSNHIPSNPIVPFGDDKNEFMLDHKIEFSTDIISQLKDFRNVERVEGVEDAFRALISSLSFQKDLKSTKFEEREYYLKNISKFKGFFTDEKFEGGDVSLSQEKLEEYSLPKFKDVMDNLDQDSNLRFKVLVLNNKVPEKPDTAFAVTTIEEKRTVKKKQTLSTQHGSIVTIYLKRGRLTTGKDERVGIIISDSDSIYYDIYKDQELISRVGKDILSDGFPNESKYLRFDDIAIPENNIYDVGYDRELGIYHFLPIFDIERQLWKFEVELRIRTKGGKFMHNPFVNFSLVHFQPYSINYNNKQVPDELKLAKDCRISAPVNSTWCYLLPERKLSVYFDQPSLFDSYGEVDLTLSFDHESLHHYDGENGQKVRTNFLLSVQGSDDKKTWFPVRSQVDNGTETTDYLVHHSLLTKKIIQNKETIASKKLRFTKRVERQRGHKYSHFRVAIMEVEWFTDESVLEKFYENNGTSPRPTILNQNITDNEEMRVRYVELIY